MDHRRPTRLSDEQLTEMLDEVGTWVIHGTSDQIFGVAGTLRRALDKADTFSRSGAVVVAIARPAPNRLFVFGDQIRRLGKVLQQTEVA